MARSKRSQGRSENVTNPHNGQGGTAVAEPPKASVTKPQPRLLASGAAKAPASPHPHVSIPISREQIEVAAYHLWQRNGGTPEDNWFEAESLMRKQAEIDL